MNLSFLRFILILAAVNVLCAGIHFGAITLLDQPVDPLFIRSYWINALSAILITGFIFLFKTKLYNSLGFIFLMGSLVKFGLFFAFFYPDFTEDGTVSKTEFLTFFIPYAANLIWETTYLVNLLNNLPVPQAVLDAKKEEMNNE